MTYRNILAFVFCKANALLNKGLIGRVAWIAIDQVGQNEFDQAGLVTAVRVVDQTAQAETVDALVTYGVRLLWRA